MSRFVPNTDLPNTGYQKEIIIDAWAQHLTLRHAQDPMFDSLRRWNREEAPQDEIPVAMTIAVATKYENVYIDTSAYTVRRYPPQLVQYMKSNGKQKVLFGSNYPMITPAKAMRGLDELGLDDEAKALFLGGNAKRVYGI